MNKRQLDTMENIVPCVQNLLETHIQMSSPGATDLGFVLLAEKPWSATLDFQPPA